jgi:colanic acid/amylovoran biosynthesis protein
VDAVLDASGFSYSDQWGPAATEHLAAQTRRWRRQGKPIVLLPQALGPFREPRARDAFRRVLDEVDLIFARDDSSAAHLAELGAAGRARVRQSPDFTVGVKGRLPEGFEPAPGRVAIIPNYRMIDKGRAGSGPAYRALLAGTARHLLARGYHPFFLVHDSGIDRELAHEVRADAGGGVEVLHEPDPRALKGILGSCHAVVASRFHALVGALTQGVPSLATGWSHKYEELFAEFGCPEALCDVAAPLPDALARLDALLEGTERERVIEGLRRTRADYARRTAEMWREVGALLGFAPPSAPVAERVGAGAA